MKPERKQLLDQAWLEALLEESYADETSPDATRIAAVMRQLQHEKSSSFIAQATADVGLSTQPTRSPWYSFRNLSALAIAASILVLAVFLSDSSNQSQAYAALAKCVQSTPGLRQYRLQIVSQRPWGGPRTAEAQLYLDASDRFVSSHPAWFGSGKVWIGGNSQERWIVPPRGPAIVGGADLVGRWLARKDIDSPYLHITTVLARMGKAYTLSKLPDEVLVAGDAQPKEVRCVHVQGALRFSRSALPTRIDLWADAETGIAQRLILQWPQTGRPGPLSWTLDRIEPTPDLPSNWFDIAGHAAGRPIRHAKSNDDFDQLP